MKPTSAIPRLLALYCALTLLAAAYPAAAAEPSAGRAIGSATAPINLFGLAAEGNKVVYAFDVSASMEASHGRPIAAVKQEVLKSIDSLDRMCQFYVIHYAQTPKLIDMGGGSGRLIFATPENKAAVHPLVAAIPIRDGTEHESALLMALKMRPDVIYLMTDGDRPQLDKRQLDRIARINGAAAVIHTIQIGLGKPAGDSDWMEKLARENGGQYKFVDVLQPKEDTKSQ
ncbi:MAG: hypothetical protein K8T25_17805 [Planctomycetia bacterium]|nr:hypothetical protein [Planctomycetia bacterium]